MALHKESYRVNLIWLHRHVGVLVSALVALLGPVVVCITCSNQYSKVTRNTIEDRRYQEAHPPDAHPVAITTREMDIGNNYISGLHSSFLSLVRTVVVVVAVDPVKSLIKYRPAASNIES
jgi:hypothetical protein